MTSTVTLVLLAAMMMPPIAAAAGVGRIVAARETDRSRSALLIAARASWLSFAAAVLTVGLTIGGLAAANVWPFRLDGAAMVVLPLITLMAAIVAQFAVNYMAADRRPVVFTRRFLLLLASILGVAVSADAVIFVGFWVATGPLLAALIGHVRGWPAAAAARRRTIRSFWLGDSALILGVGILVGVTGTSSIAGIAQNVAAAPAWLVHVALAGVLAGGLVRSAIYPAAGWLLTSMTAPTPVSALMHAGLVNAGGLVVALWLPVLQAAPTLFHILFVIGATTAVIGSMSMLLRPDVKRALGASTMSQMGFMIMQCGLGAMAHALYHMVAHGLFKATLFLGAGGMVGTPRKPGPVDPRRATAIGAIVFIGASMAVLAVNRGAIDLSNPKWLLSAIAIIAAAQAASTLARTGGGSRNAVRLVLVITLAAGIYGTGVGLVTLALGSNAEVAAIRIGPFHWAVLAVFAGLWLAQTLLAARPSAIPPRLYMVLLSLGRGSARPGSANPAAVDNQIQAEATENSPDLKNRSAAHA